jgi:hypothetical protein
MRNGTPQGPEFLPPRDDARQSLQRNRDIGAVPLLAFVNGEVAVGAQRLHESLDRADAEGLVTQVVRRRCAVMLKKILDPCGVKTIDVRVIQQRRQVITRRPEPCALEIHEPHSPVLQQDVFGLEVPVDTHARQGCRAPGNLAPLPEIGRAHV